MLDKHLTDDVYVKILQQVYKTTEVEFISAEFKSISEHVEGFLGEHNNINVTFKLRGVTKTQIFFLKTKPQKNKLQIEMTNEFDAYKKEIFFYDYLLKEFEKYGCDVNFAPKCYYVVPNELLIFEDLKEQGFKLNNRHTCFNLGQIKCALKSLAAFHGAGIVYTLKKTKELKRDYTFIKEFPDILEERLYIMEDNPNGYAMKFWNGSYKNIRMIIQSLPENDEYKEKFTSMVFNHKFGEVFAKPSKYLKTCGHGDLWSNNMMFKYENGEASECRLLDYQICRYFYPAFDVILLVFGNTTTSLRKDNLQEIYRYYYDELECVVKKQGYQLNDVMSFSDFLQTIKLVQRDAMLQVTSAITGVNLPKEFLDDLVQAGDPEKMQEFFFDSANICAEAFKTNENYRTLITEVFQEYYRILLDYE